MDRTEKQILTLAIEKGLVAASYEQELRLLVSSDNGTCHGSTDCMLAKGTLVPVMISPLQASDLCQGCWTYALPNEPCNAFLAACRLVDKEDDLAQSRKLTKDANDLLIAETVQKIMNILEGIEEDTYSETSEWARELSQRAVKERKRLQRILCNPERIAANTSYYRVKEAIYRFEEAASDEYAFEDLPTLREAYAIGWYDQLTTTWEAHHKRGDTLEEKIEAVCSVLEENVPTENFSTRELPSVPDRAPLPGETVTEYLAHLWVQEAKNTARLVVNEFESRHRNAEETGEVLVALTNDDWEKADSDRIVWGTYLLGHYRGYDILRMPRYLYTWMFCEKQPWLVDDKVRNPSWEAELQKKDTKGVVDTALDLWNPRDVGKLRSLTNVLAAARDIVR